MKTSIDILPPQWTWKHLSDKYDANQVSTTPRRPNWRSRRCRSSSWSTVSKAAVRSSRQRADVWVWPLSAASRRSLYTLVTAVSVLWNRRYAECIGGIMPLLSRNSCSRRCTTLSRSLERNGNTISTDVNHLRLITRNSEATQEYFGLYIVEFLHSFRFVLVA